VTTFAVTRARRESWNDSRGLREQEEWDEHARFMEALVDDGFVVLGGPLGDGPEVLLIVDADSEEEIADRLADDPWTPMGLLRTVKIERWKILLRRPPEPR
jgi:uncharacterized protein YciI